MNKNYRSIWNDALGAWVAVSEIETAKGKPAGSRVCSAKGGASVLKTVLRTIPLVLGWHLASAATHMQAQGLRLPLQPPQPALLKRLKLRLLSEHYQLQPQ